MLSLTSFTNQTRTGDRFLIAVWMGSLTLATALLGASIFTPLNATISAGVAVTLMFAALVIAPARRVVRELLESARLEHVVAFTAILLGVAWFSTQELTFFDSGLYHAGVIEWLAQFGSVKGLAHLEWRLGFTSSWFALAAPFNVGPFIGRMETLTGAYALLLASIQFGMTLVRVVRGEGRSSDWFAVFALLVVVTWLMRVGITLSPSPDVPVIVMTIVVIWSLLVTSEGRKVGPIQTPSVNPLLPGEAVPLLLAAGMIPLKLTAAPVFLVALLFFLFGAWTKPQLALVLAISTLLVLPYFLANLATSGCPAFPSPILCTHLPWSVPADTAAREQAVGRDFLRWTGPTPGDANWWNWLPHWAVSEPLGLLAIAFLLGSAAALAVLTRKELVKQSVFVLAAALGGVAYVLVLSPTFRFLLPYACLAPAYLCGWLCARLRLRPIVLLPPFLAALAALEFTTVTDYHSNGLTPSAVAYLLIVPAAAVAVGVAWLARGSLETLTSESLPVRQLHWPVLGLILGVVFATSNLSLIPRPLSFHTIRTTDGLADLVAPPLLPTLAKNEKTPHLINDVEYVSPIPAIGVCWATIPCSIETLPYDLRLLNPGRGIAGGFAQRQR